MMPGLYLTLCSSLGGHAIASLKRGSRYHTDAQPRARQCRAPPCSGQGGHGHALCHITNRYRVSWT